MKEKIKKIKLRKIQTIILILTVISLILGILYISILSKENKALVSSSLANFFTNIKKANFNYNKALFNSLTNNIVVDLTIWLLGISIIGIPIVIFIIITKSFILGFSLSSIIFNYGIKGILLAIVYIIPHILSLFIILILSYYSIDFSLMLFRLLFKRKDYNKKIIVKRYLKILIVSTIFLITSSVLEVYVIPKLLRLII